MTTPSPRGSPCPRGFSLCSHLLQLAPDFVSVDPSPKYGPVPRLCASNTMGHAVGRSAFLSIAISIISLLLVSPLGSAPTRIFEVATDSAVGNNSLGMPGSQDVIRDPFGKYLAVYVDSQGNLSTAFANSDPASPGAWGIPVKSPSPLVAYRRPATVLTTPLTMRVLAEGGPAAGDLVDVPVQIIRDLVGNIVSVSYGNPAVVATSAQYASATLAHDGSILAVWNSAVPGSSSTVFAMRWTFAGGWRSVSNPFSAAPDVVIADVSDTEPIHPNVIERPDTFAIYVMGNRGPRRHPKPPHDEQRMGSPPSRPADRRLLSLHNRHAALPTVGVGIRRGGIHAVFEWRLVRDPDRRRQRDEQHGRLSSTPDDARTRRRRLAGNDLREGEDGPRHDHLRPSE